MKEERIEGSFTRVFSFFDCSENACGSGRLVLIINQIFFEKQAVDGS